MLPPRLSLPLLAMLLGACAAPHDDQVTIAPAVRDTPYMTFTIQPVRAPGHRQDLEERFDNALHKAMEAKGYRYQEKGSDLTIIYALGLSPEPGVTMRPVITPGGAVYNQTELTQDERARLALRILDGFDERVLFEAQISRQLHDPKLTQQGFDRAVAELLKDFPARPAP